MSARNKLIARFRTQPKDFTWDELVRLLQLLGYREVPGGKTGGSRRKFVHPTAPLIALHKPHPSNVVKRYVLAAIYDLLLDEGFL